MTITPAELTAERLAQIAEARKYLKWALMDTVARFAAANSDPEGMKPIKHEATGLIAKLCLDIESLEQIRGAYERKDGIFKDYIL